MRIFWGLIGIAIGTLMLWKTYTLLSFLGRFDWAERYLGGGLGGTSFFYKAAGVLVVIASALYMFGFLENLFAPLGSVFGGLAPK